MANRFNSDLYAPYYGDGGSDSDSEAMPARDDSAMRRSVGRGTARAARDPDLKRRAVFGGSARKTVIADTRPSRNDVAAPRVPGSSVPMAFARYTPTGINMANYKFHYSGGMRVAVDRQMPHSCVQDLLKNIHKVGPAAAGYVRIADTIVPSDLDYGDRFTLSTAANHRTEGLRRRDSGRGYEL